MHYLYRITIITNQKVYIGQTQDYKQRWRQHKLETKKENPKMIINCAMKKYGIDNCLFEVIAICKSWEDANEMETLLVSQYNSLVPNGYNVSNGGSNAPKTEEWKQHMSIQTKKRFAENPQYAIDLRAAQHNYIDNLKERGLSMSGTFQPGHEVKPEWIEAMRQANLGRVQSEAEILKRMDSMRETIDGYIAEWGHHWNVGKPSHMLGKTHTEEARKKMSDANIGYRRSPATEFKKGTNYNAYNRKLTQEDEKEIKIKYLNGQSQRSLAREYNIDRSCIKRIIKELK